MASDIATRAAMRWARRNGYAFSSALVQDVIGVIRASHAQRTRRENIAIHTWLLMAGAKQSTVEIVSHALRVARRGSK